MLDDALTARLNIALDAAKAAGDVTLQTFRHGGLKIEVKGDGSPVTRTDRMAEHAIRQILGGHFPEDAVAGEEYGTCLGTNDYTWILDPIDGTFSFIKGVPLYGTLIGLEHEGQLKLGVIHMPALNETVYAARGHGAWHRVGSAEPVPARVSETSSLADAVVSTTAFEYFSRCDCAEVHDRLVRRVPHTRGWSDCYAAVLLATGRIDAIVEPYVHPWDLAALFPVITEAGGRATDWAGRDSIRSRCTLMTNGRVHDDLLELLPDAVTAKDSPCTA